MIRIEETTIIDAPIERCFDLSRSVEVHLLSNVHSGEQAIAAGGVTSGLVGLGQQVTWRARHFYIWQHGCPVKSRTESVGWEMAVTHRWNRISEVPVKWGFSRKG
jgi:hypothetical protein